MNILKTILTAALSLAAIAAFSQSGTTDCSFFQHGKFKYIGADDSTSYIVMNGSKQTEYSKKNDYIIESSVRWITDCSYIMTMTKITIPNFPYHPGDQMKVDITKVEGDIIYYTSTVNGNSWEGKFKKL
jgi:hypothetical protein